VSTRFKTFQQAIDSVPDLVDFLYNDTPGTHSRMRGNLSPVPAEQSNWRDEQRAWRETAVLFDQSHHMPELFLSGPDALRLLTRVGVNSLANFGPGVARQFVACNSRGQVIGECILHDLGGTYELISGKPILNWVEFHARTGGYDVTVKRDEATWENPNRTNFRFGMDGPFAWRIFQEVIEGEAPEIKFFHTARVRIAGVDVMALRHGMAGHRGVEISGPSAEGPKVRQAILETGAKYGIRPGGAKAYFSAVVESGWISYPLPAIYRGEDEAAYRAWLPGDAWEALFQLGGSFRPDSVEDYYVTPYDLGLGRIVKFDHDFIGRAALEKISAAPPRTKVALEWHNDDVAKVLNSQFGSGPTYKWIDFPTTDYAQIHRDRVQTPDGKLIGLSTHGGYSVNEKAAVSLGIVDIAHAEPGTELVIVWGEAGGGSRKPVVERHEQTTIRATVRPVPFAKTVRDMKYQLTGAGS
jgi:vanillate/3-O-methylgallate O-demethylase